jgi:poly-beta-1,6-N-acetyl-D-glucosamine synthase
LTLAFWLSFALIAYVYAGYPALLMLWARLRRRPLTTGDRPTSLPGVAIILAVRNEGRRIAARLDNLLELDYPADRRQIIVVSDGSTDDTLAVLEPYRSSVDVIVIAASGKAVALNAGVARATHEILVFADARQAFASDALIELTAPFGDSRVGAVSGELLLDCESNGRRIAVSDRRRGPALPAARTPRDRRLGMERRSPSQSTIAEGVGLYWQFEKRMRRLESAVDSTLGATGAIYAMRRSLWRPLPPVTILDDVLAPMRCVLAGYRVVFNERARAFDRTVPDADAEAQRKIRTLAGNYQVLSLEPGLLLPWRNGVWLQYWSHKVGRLLVPYALIVLMATSIALAERSIVYATALAAQCTFYLLAAYGAWLDFKESVRMGGAIHG